MMRLLHGEHIMWFSFDVRHVNLHFGMKKTNNKTLNRERESEKKRKSEMENVVSIRKKDQVKSHQLFIHTVRLNFNSSFLFVAKGQHIV